MKLSTVDIAAANGAATRIPAIHGIDAASARVNAISGMMRSEAPSSPGTITRDQQKMMISGK